jgi:uncharacterized membrane protein
MADQIIRFIAENNFRAISGRLGLVAIVPLIVLLIQRELLRAYQPDPARQSGVRWMTVAIIPLMVVLTLILAVRLLELLGHI